MTSRQKRKGDAAEREVAAMLAALTGLPVRRKLGAGRFDDAGDLEGAGDWCLQVRAYADVLRATRGGLADLDRQQQHAGARYAALLVRRPGGRWAAVLDLPRLAGLIVATQNGDQ